MASSSFFSKVPEGRPIEIFALMKAYADDPFEHKVNGSVGAYRTNEGKPWVLPVVRKAEMALAQDPALHKEYLPILGLEQFSTMATALLIGDSNKILIEENRAFGIHSLSGTGSLRLGAEFLCRVMGYDTVYFSQPTWANHQLVFKYAGFQNLLSYRYWSEEGHCVNVTGLLDDLENAVDNSVVILHACAHNPTGCDPTHHQWEQIATVMQRKRLFPFFDCAYQGFATGDLDRDAWPVRYFLSKGFEMFCAQSFAKNFGLYNERIGNLTVIVNNALYTPNIKSQFTLLVRGMYSNPPNHGARIITYVFSQPELLREWKENVKTMSDRITQMRQALRQRLETLGTPGDWSHITSQIGMFSYTGLNEQQCENMIKKHHVYMLKSGRLSMCGLNTENVDYVANAIYETVTTIKSRI